MTKTQIIIAIILIALVVMYFLFGSGAKAGKDAPEIESTLINGEEFKLSDLKGNYVLIDFWGSWCGPCLREAPELIKFYDDYKDVQFADGSKLEMVSIALEKNDRRWKSTAERIGYTWENQIVDISPVVLMSSFAQSYGITDIPHKILVDPNGKIIGNRIKFDEMRKVLESAK